MKDLYTELKGLTLTPERFFWFKILITADLSNAGTRNNSEFSAKIAWIFPNINKNDYQWKFV